MLEEALAYAPLLGPAFVAFFAEAASGAVRGAWDDVALARPTEAMAPSPPSAAIAVDVAFAHDGPLSRGLEGFEERTEQRELARAIELTMREGGPLVAEAGTGVGKSLAYLVAALARAGEGERVIVSTHTLPLQDQLVRKDLPALQDALGTNVSVTVLTSCGPNSLPIPPVEPPSPPLPPIKVVAERGRGPKRSTSAGTRRTACSRPRRGSR